MQVSDFSVGDRVVYHATPTCPNAYISIEGVEGKVVNFHTNSEGTEFIYVDFNSTFKPSDSALCYPEELTKVEQ